MKRTRNLYHYQFNKCRKAEEKIRSNNLLNACLNSSDGSDIFKEIKAMRKTKQVIATSIDGVKENIPDHFKTIYSELYNSVDDAENMAKVKGEVECSVTNASLSDVKLVTPDIVKEAASKLKAGKSDPVYTFSSDCIKVDSNALAGLLAIIIREGHNVPTFKFELAIPLIPFSVP